jgi:hypothetical protein
MPRVCITKCWSLRHEALFDGSQEDSCCCLLGHQLVHSRDLLSTVALSSPLSALAQQAKNEIRKILIISDMSKSESPIAPQTKQILGALVNFILDKELEALTCTESMPPLTSVRASPHRNNSGGQEDEFFGVYVSLHNVRDGISTLRGTCESERSVEDVVDAAFEGAVDGDAVSLLGLG